MLYFLNSFTDGGDFFLTSSDTLPFARAARSLQLFFSAFFLVSH